MSTKIALLNGRLYNPNQQTFEKTNVILNHYKIGGLGYIPDDDDSTQIDISHHYIFPNIFIPIISTSFTNGHPHHDQDLMTAQTKGITGSGIIPTNSSECYGKTITSCLKVNQTHGFNAFPLHCHTPDSPQMIGLWITTQTETTAIEHSIKFNKPLIVSSSNIPLNTLISHIERYPKATWHIIISNIDDIFEFNTVKEKCKKVTLSIFSHLITPATIPHILPHIKSGLMTTIGADLKNNESILQCFPLLENELSITDIYGLFAQNILNLYQLSLKNVPLTHEPHLTIFHPKTGQINSVVIKGYLKQS